MWNVKTLNFCYNLLEHIWSLTNLAKLILHINSMHIVLSLNIHLIVQTYTKFKRYNVVQNIYTWCVFKQQNYAKIFQNKKQGLKLLWGWEKILSLMENCEPQFNGQGFKCHHDKLMTCMKSHFKCPILAFKGGLFEYFLQIPCGKYSCQKKTN
jgi:hypothetical protein